MLEDPIEFDLSLDSSSSFADYSDPIVGANLDVIEGQEGDRHSPVLVEDRRTHAVDLGGRHIVDLEDLRTADPEALRTIADAGLADHTPVDCVDSVDSVDSKSRSHSRHLTISNRLVVKVKFLTTGVLLLFFLWFIFVIHKSLEIISQPFQALHKRHDCSCRSRRMD